MTHTTDAGEPAIRFRPGFNRLLAQLGFQALLLLVAVNLLAPSLLIRIPPAIAIPAAVLIAVAPLMLQSARAVRRSRPLHPELPALQRVTMGDEVDEDQRRTERAQLVDRAWVSEPAVWFGFILINLALMSPWPELSGIPTAPPALRLQMLVALHAAAAVHVVHLWVKAQKAET